MIFLSLAVYTYVPTLYLKMIDQFLQMLIGRQSTQHFDLISQLQPVIAGVTGYFFCTGVGAAAVVGNLEYKYIGQKHS